MSPRAPVGLRDARPENGLESFAPQIGAARCWRRSPRRSRSQSWRCPSSVRLVSSLRQTACWISPQEIGGIAAVSLVFGHRAFVGCSRARVEVASGGSDHQPEGQGDHQLDEEKPCAPRRGSSARRVVKAEVMGQSQGRGRRRFWSRCRKTIQSAGRRIGRSVRRSVQLTTIGRWRIAVVTASRDVPPAGRLARVVHPRGRTRPGPRATSSVVQFVVAEGFPRKA